MKRRISLGMSLSTFLLEANRLAGVVVRRAEQLSAASGGRIGAHTAVEMQNLAAEIFRIERERDRSLVGTSRALVRRAETLMTEIGAAARFIALDKPIVGMQLHKLRVGRRKRSSADVLQSLYAHAYFARKHPDEFEKILPAGLLDEADRTFAAIEQHHDKRTSARWASQSDTRVRDQRVAQLRALISLVRMAAPRDPELASSVTRKRRTKVAQESGDPKVRNT